MDRSRSAFARGDHPGTRRCAAAQPRTVRVQPVTPDIAIKVPRLPSSFHRDPADRLIVATCRVLGAPLVSHDRLMGSRLAKAWRPAPTRPRS